MAKDISSDDEFNKHIAANKFVLAIFMESDTEMEVSWIFGNIFYISYYELRLTSQI